MDSLCVEHTEFCVRVSLQCRNTTHNRVRMTSEECPEAIFIMSFQLTIVTFNFHPGGEIITSSFFFVSLLNLTFSMLKIIPGVDA